MHRSTKNSIFSLVVVVLYKRQRLNKKIMRIESFFDDCEGLGEALRIFDDSMEPLIPEGSCILTEPREKVKSGDVVVAGFADVAGGLRITIRRIIIKENGLTWIDLVPINPNYKTSTNIMQVCFKFLIKVIGYAQSDFDFYSNLRELTEKEQEKTE